MLMPCVAVNVWFDRKFWPFTPQHSCRTTYCTLPSPLEKISWIWYKWNVARAGSATRAAASDSAASRNRRGLVFMGPPWTESGSDLRSRAYNHGKHELRARYSWQP